MPISFGSSPAGRVYPLDHMLSVVRKSVRGYNGAVGIRTPGGGRVHPPMGEKGPDKVGPVARPGDSDYGKRKPKKNKYLSA